MLEIYAQAWVVDEEMANVIRDAWYRREIDDLEAELAWWSVTISGRNMNPCQRIESPLAGLTGCLTAVF